MSFDKFIQTRTIAKSDLVLLNEAVFPTYKLSSFIDFENDGFLVGIHFMVTNNQNAQNWTAISGPDGAMVAKVSGDNISIPPGGNATNYSGASILLSHLDLLGGPPVPSDPTPSWRPSSRQTTIAYDADSKRIPIKSNDRLGVYLCSNGDTNFSYTLTAYFVRS
jgi:hypothetical protein